MFSAITAKILAGVSAVLLVGLLVTGWQLRSSNGQIEELRNANAACEAARAVQNASISRMQAEGEARAAEQQTALSEARRANEAALSVAERLRRLSRAPQAQAGCDTPGELREAENML